MGKTASDHFPERKRPNGKRGRGGTNSRPRHARPSRCQTRCCQPAGMRRLTREQRAVFARAKNDPQRNGGFLLNAGVQSLSEGGVHASARISCPAVQRCPFALRAATVRLLPSACYGYAKSTSHHLTQCSRRCETTRTLSAKAMWQVRIEFTTLGLWDLRAANCATATLTACYAQILISTSRRPT